MRKELDTVGLVVGFVLFVMGVAMYSARLALIVAGLLICAGSIALGLGRAQKARRRDP